jgi:hypothetical protein
VASAREKAATSAAPAYITARYSTALAGITALDPGSTEPDGPVYIAYLSL